MNATVRLSADKAEAWVPSQNLEASLAAHFGQAGEKFVLAMKATRRIVANVLRPIKFLGTNDLEGDVLLAGKLDRIIKLIARQARRIGNDGQHLVTNGLKRCPRQKRGVDAS